MLPEYEYKKAQLDAVMEEIEKLCGKIPESEQMLAIKGIGVITVAGFLAEVGCEAFRITQTDTKAGRTLITGEQLWKAQRTDDHKQKRSE